MGGVWICLKKYLEVYGFDSFETTDSLSFYVSVASDDGDFVDIGSFSVEENGMVAGEIYKLECNDLILTARNIMLESGLREVVGDDIKEDDVFFDGNDSTFINLDLIYNPNPERWHRARNYIEKNNIVVKTLDSYKTNKKAF